jgi:hypothetical protein
MHLKATVRTVCCACRKAEAHGSGARHTGTCPPAGTYLHYITAQRSSSLTNNTLSGGAPHKQQKKQGNVRSGTNA